MPQRKKQMRLLFRRSKELDEAEGKQMDRNSR
jgi:hypothetical protein